MQYFLDDLPLNDTQLRQISVMTYHLHVLLRVMKVYVTPCIVAVGVLGNITNVTVFVKSRLRKTSCSPYLTLLSVVDTCFLSALFSLWLVYADLDVYSLSGGCQAVTLIMSGASFVSVWAVTALALDRVLMVYPNVHSCLIACPGKRPKLTVLCIGTSGFVIYMNLCLLYSNFLTPTGQFICIPMPEFYHVMGILEKMDAIFDFILPLVLTFIFNVITIYSIRRLLSTGRSIPRVRQRNANVASIQQRSKVEMTMTKLSLCTTAMFFLLNMPGHLLRLVLMIAENQENYALIYDPKVFLFRQLLMNLFFIRPALTPIFSVLFCAPYRKAIKSKLSAIYSVVYVKCCKNSSKASM